jgi:hypothetical protein
MSVLASLADWRRPADVARLAGFTAALQAALLVFFIAGTHGWLTKGVGPTTTDYVSFYAAGELANQGAPEAAYDPDRHLKAEEAATEPGIGYQYFFNPPTYLLIMAPLARLPYLASFLVMQGLTLGLWLWLGTRVAGGGTAATLSLLSVPSVWWVLGLGQNSFLSAGLMAAGTLLLQSRPVAAGMAFGALCYKPHLGLMIPVALLAAGQWRAIAAAGVTVTAAVAATLLLYGRRTWEAFFAMAQRSVGGAIDNGRVLLSGRADPTGAAQLLGLSPSHARLVWLGCLAIAIVTVAWLWRRGGREARSAGLAASVLVAAPFALMYDLVMASLAAAWLVRAGRRTGFLPGEKPVIGMLLLADLLAAHPIVADTRIPFAALAGPCLLALAIRRGYNDTTMGARGNVQK